MSNNPTEEQLILQAARHELWNRGELAVMFLHAGQKSVYDRINSLPSSVKEVACKIGRRWGKTYLTLILCLERCIKNPGSQVIFCAPSSKHSASIVVPVLREITKDAPPGLIKPLKSELRWLFSNGSQITLGGFDTASESFRGLASDLIIVDEGGATNPENFMYVTRSILLPTMLGRTNSKIIHTFTPAPVSDHPIHTVVEPKAILRDACFSYPTTSSPLYTEQELKEMCEEVGGPNSLAWQREYLVENKTDTEKVCIPEFDEKIHVQTIKPPVGTKYWISCDIGGTIDLSTFQLMAYDYTTDKVIVVDERTLGTNPSNPLIVEKINELKQSVTTEYHIPVYMDAPGSLKSDLRQTYGLEVLNVYKPATKYGIHEKLVAIRQAFSSNKIVINPNCKLLIVTLRSALFNSSRTDYQRTDIIGHADHLDTLLYGYRHKITNITIPPSTVDESIQLELEAIDRQVIELEQREWWDQ